MARFVGKTFVSLNSMLNNSGLFLSNQDKSSKLHPFSTDSKSFLRKLRSADSKKSEEDVVLSYLSAIEKRLSEPDVPSAEVADMIQMCMTCETMGYPTPFIYVHCLKLAQKGNLQEKHTGYSAAAFFLNPHHELVILLINTMQKDLQSSNYVEVLLALTSICNLINVDTVHNMLHLIEGKLNHEKSSVRKSAILTLGHCLQLINSESAYQMCIPKLEKALTDSDLEVVSAAVCTMYKFILKLPCDFTYLIKSLVELQDQILLRRVPRGMVYCDIPAPWLQLDILKLLKHLCTLAEHFEQVMPVLKKTLQQVSLQNTVSYAIIHQVIETVTFIQPTNEIIEMVLASVSNFLKAKNINLKLMGIEALILVVKRLKPSITVAQQEVIMECLMLKDETLQLKTLELLFHLANPSNVQAICKKLMEFLIGSTNTDKQKELALKVIQLALKYLERQEWVVSVCVSVFMEAGDLLPSTDIYAVIDTISKDVALKEFAKKRCLNLCQDGNHLPPSVLKLISAVLSTSSEFEEHLPFLLTNANEEATTWLLVSLAETFLKTKHLSPGLGAFLKDLKIKYENPSQILTQLLQMQEMKSDLQGFYSNQKVDPSLTFLDGFVVQALENSQCCFLPSSFRTKASIEETGSSLKLENFECCDISFAQESVPSPSRKSPTYSEFSSPSTSFQSLPFDKDVQPSSVPTKSTAVWTEDGRKNVSNIQDNFKSDVSNSSEKEKELLDLFAGIS